MRPPEVRPCDVCVLLDNDSSPKPCLFCSMCGTWMCVITAGAISERRTRAFARKALRAAGLSSTQQQK